ncbi:hypothetical protein HPB51_028954 [Rhipicephalus microplus]|uniref:Reverse transcriptase domain-containing protein n=1 Tax=Rhipicephalus microplus TaxID=6941 RepID=A0A9J6CVH1_RHIMP|nr:hypothetical protein HPB51_028954 [Rhipicephalus microplus]
MSASFRMMRLFRSPIIAVVLQSLREEGKNAAQKFWQYVQTLERRQQNSPQLRDADTNQPVAHVRQPLTRYISGLFGSMGNDGDRDASAAATLHPALGERQEEAEPRWAVSSVTVICALVRMSTRTATGPDEVPARLVKCLRPQARKKLADQLSSILSGAEIPKGWRQGRITLILKQGGATDLLQSYHPITVTSVMYRMFAGILREWLSDWAETKNLLTELQNGFRSGRRLEDNILTLTQCAEIAKLEGRSLLCCFLDVQKAYDSVAQAALFDCMNHLGLLEILISTVKRMYRGCHGMVANEAVQGDIGWSSFEAREAASKLTFHCRLMYMSRERWSRRVFDYLMEPLTAENQQGRTKEIRQRIKEAEEEKWRQTQGNKSSLLLYRQHKDTIAPVPLYDNGLGSVLLFEARAGAPRTLVRKQAYDGELVSVVCRACGGADETIAHIVTECPQLSPSSSNTDLAAALGFVDTGDVVDYAAQVDAAEEEPKVRIWQCFPNNRSKSTIDFSLFASDKPVERNHSTKHYGG